MHERRQRIERESMWAEALDVGNVRVGLNEPTSLWIEEARANFSTLVEPQEYTDGLSLGGVDFPSDVHLEASHLQISSVCDATFNGTLKLARSHLKMVPMFIDCHLRGEIDCEEAEFYSRVRAIGLVIGGNAVFKRAVFKGGAQFTSTCFARSADFGGAAFSRFTSFYDVQFDEEASFDNACFDDGASFFFHSLRSSSKFLWCARSPSACRFVRCGQVVPYGKNVE